MSIGRIESVSAIGASRIGIVWDDGHRAQIDFAPLIAAFPQLAPLADEANFPQRSEDGWSVEFPQCGIDFGAGQLRRWADEQAGEAMPAAAFRAWMEGHALTLDRAAEALGLSRRTIAYYLSGEQPVPKTVMLATEGYDKRRRPDEAMPATPAWPPHSLPRLFVDRALVTGESVTVEGTYLGAVLRLGPGDKVKLFNDRTGEWLAEIAAAGKKRCTLTVRERLREREQVPDLWLLFAPIKRGRIDWLVEKATELGVARLQPVLTQRTILDRLNLHRLRAHAVEAAEQCERTALPELTEPVKLDALLKAWPAERTLYFADERGGEAFAAQPGPAAMLIGPEGGFTDEERAAVRALPQACPVSLGPRILRADTAALAAVTLWMAAAGDW